MQYESRLIWPLWVAYVLKYVLKARMFIGRNCERQRVKTWLLQNGFLVLYGQPLVGKSSLAMQVAVDLQVENRERGQSCSINTVLCNTASDWSGLKSAICQEFSLDDTQTNEQLARAVISRKNTFSPDTTLLLLLKVSLRQEAERSDVQTLARFLQRLSSSDVKIVITSRRKLPIQVVAELQQLQVGPLTLDDASELFHHAAPDVIMGDFRELIQRYSFGLPQLVLQMAELVKGTLGFTASELTQELSDNPGLLMKGLEDEARELFSKHSPEVQERLMKLAMLLGGSFNAQHLQAAESLDERKVKVLARRLQDEGCLIVQAKIGRMDIEPLVLLHMGNIEHVNADDQARLRVVTLLGRVLTRAERDFYLKGLDTVYGHLEGEWPVLRHCLRQAIHCTENIYQAFMEVALKTDRLMTRLFPHEALAFYEAMATAAVRFGTPQDQAVLQNLIGMAHSVGIGTGWNKALEHFHLALPVLRKKARSLSYLRLLCDLGFTLYRLNNFQQSERYLREAVSLFSDDIGTEANPKLVYHLIRARYLLSVPVLFQGHFQEAKELVKDTMELLEQTAPHHPVKPMLINSLGLVYERSGEDQNMALFYYERSLAARRPYQALMPTDLVACLNNIGMQYQRRGDCKSALTYLEECLAIRLRDNRWHFSTGLTYQHIGHVYLKMGDYRKAAANLQEAATIYKRCTPKHDALCKVALSLAHVHVVLEDLLEAKLCLQDVIDCARNADLSDDGLAVLLSAIEHTTQLEGQMSKKVTSLLSWAQELLSKFQGDSCERVRTHRDIIDALITPAVIPDVIASENETPDLTLRISELCQECRTFSDRGKVVLLWDQYERQGQVSRSAFSRLMKPPSRPHDPQPSNVPDETPPPVEKADNLDRPDRVLSQGQNLQEQNCSAVQEHTPGGTLRPGYSQNPTTVCPTLEQSREDKDLVTRTSAVAASSDTRSRPSTTHASVSTLSGLSAVEGQQGQQVSPLFCVHYVRPIQETEHDKPTAHTPHCSDRDREEERLQYLGNVPLQHDGQLTQHDEHQPTTPDEHHPTPPDEHQPTQPKELKLAMSVVEPVRSALNSTTLTGTQSSAHSSSRTPPHGGRPNASKSIVNVDAPVTCSREFISTEETVRSGRRPVSGHQHTSPPPMTVHQHMSPPPMTVRLGTMDISLTRNRTAPTFLQDQVEKLACLTQNAGRCPQALLDQPEHWSQTFQRSRGTFNQSQLRMQDNPLQFQYGRDNATHRGLIDSDFHSIHPHDGQARLNPHNQLIVKPLMTAKSRNEEFLVFSELNLEIEYSQHRDYRPHYHRGIPENQHAPGIKFREEQSARIKTGHSVSRAGVPENLQGLVFQFQDEHGPVPAESSNSSSTELKMVLTEGGAEEQTLGTLDSQWNPWHQISPSGSVTAESETGNEHEAGVSFSAASLSESS